MTIFKEFSISFSVSYSSMSSVPVPTSIAKIFIFFYLSWRYINYFNSVSQIDEYELDIDKSGNYELIYIKYDKHRPTDIC